MRIKSFVKYILRFLFLQSLLTYITIYYFDNFLIPDSDMYEDLKGFTFRNQIDANLFEDASRFLPFIDKSLIRIDIFLALFIFFFLIFLFSTKFYTYVNELSFSIDRNYSDEYLSIYLTWTTALMIFVTMFRFSNLISRGYLLLFSFIIPVVLLVFRNSEFLSSLMGRPVTAENYITFNLKDDSVFRELRIMTFRKNLKNFDSADFNRPQSIIDSIDKLNKVNNINLVILNFENRKTINKKLEDYLIKLNKKILIISKNPINFQSYFINRSEVVSGYTLTYFNNDIQYGSKYILKRVIDITFSFFFISFFSPLFLLIYLYLYLLDGSPVILKQERIGLHGKSFEMYKFRTMKKGSHSLRDELKKESKNDAEIFKIENDPRIISGAEILRNYSLDELPQFFNVLRGNMSVVGPRPLFGEDTLLFSEKYMRRLNVLPGITGLLQINDRNTSEFSTWFKYDIEYIENWSLFLDIKIIFLTPFSLFKKEVKGI